MKTSRITVKGQVTIPAKVRRQLGLRQGDEVGFVFEGDKVVLLPVTHNIEAAFGLVKADKTASLDDMEKAIRSRGGKA